MGPSVKTTQQFILDACAQHGDKYDYSKTNYIYCTTPVVIGCKTHGDFFQLPTTHSANSKEKCLKCLSKCNMGLKAFIKKANIIHNFKYNYSDSVYINVRSFIDIKCNIHGIFSQRARIHLAGSGCAKCAMVNYDDFVVRANKIHKFKYCYSNVIFSKLTDKIKIYCTFHGIFKQGANGHLAGQGCPKCAKNRPHDTQSFINKAMVVHNGYYTYNNVKYINIKTKIIINCPVHGNFVQVPDNHLSGSGCKKCSFCFSKLEQLWLDNLGVKVRQFAIKINNKLFIVDGFNSNTNTIYEFYGDFWHGNPNVYKKSDINCLNKKTFGELYSNTIKREGILTKAGYKIVSIWEDDFK